MDPAFHPGINNDKETFGGITQIRGDSLLLGLQHIVKVTTSNLIFCMPYNFYHVGSSIIKQLKHLSKSLFKKNVIC